MLYKDLKEKEPVELQRMIAETRGLIHGLDLKLSVNQLKNVRSVRASRKDLARMMTKLNQPVA